MHLCYQPHGTLTAHEQIPAIPLARPTWSCGVAWSVVHLSISPCPQPLRQPPLQRCTLLGFMAVAKQWPYKWRDMALIVTNDERGVGI